MRRARTDHAKEQRRGAILRAATSLLDRSRYDTVTMAAVAREAGIAKGTTYLYFATKEQLFLALLEEEYAAWFGDARVALRMLPADPDLGAVRDALVGTVKDRPRFLELMQLLHGVLEQNIPVETALAFKTRLRDEVTGLALVLSEVTGVPMPRAGRLLQGAASALRGALARAVESGGRHILGLVCTASLQQLANELGHTGTKINFCGRSTPTPALPSRSHDALRPLRQRPDKLRRRQCRDRRRRGRGAL